MEGASDDSTNDSGQVHFPLPPLVTLMMFAGALGGCLYNTRGIVKHTEAGDFDSRFAAGYYLAPFSSAICGLSVVVLILGGVLTLDLGPQAEQSVLQHPGRLMPFVAVAVIAGYGTRQFKRKLNALADTLFGGDA